MWAKLGCKTRAVYQHISHVSGKSQARGPIWNCEVHSHSHHCWALVSGVWMMLWRIGRFGGLWGWLLDLGPKRKDQKPWAAGTHHTLPFQVGLLLAFAQVSECHGFLEDQRHRADPLRKGLQFSGSGSLHGALVCWGDAKCEVSEWYVGICWGAKCEV